MCPGSRVIRSCTSKVEPSSLASRCKLAGLSRVNIRVCSATVESVLRTDHCWSNLLRSILMNIGMPSIVIKMLRSRFDQQWSVRKTDSTGADQTRMLTLLTPASLHLDATLQGPTCLAQD